MATPTNELARLTAALQFLASYLESENAPMIILDAEYRILGTNRAYAAQFGSDSPVIGQKCFRISHGYHRPCDLMGEHCPMKQAITTRAPDRVLHVHHTPRGPEHVDVELRPVLDENGQVVAFVERLTPVTEASPQPRADKLVGNSDSFNTALAALQRAASSRIPVLLLGESGTGKELFARALHRGSPRSGAPLVIVDCSGLTESLLESELFGHERGAFTSASNRKIGLAETAHGGTLFLDEIGDVPMTAQVKLLRFIESGTFRRVGGTETLRADVRFVAATHKPLKQMVQSGEFRQDLYYRLSAFPIHLPSLRERVADIPLLVTTLLRTIAPSGAWQVEEKALELLCRYDYPGNIRELRNILERACLLASDGCIKADNLPVELLEHADTHRLNSSGPIELSQAVAAHRGTRAQLAAKLGLSERTLYRRIKELGLEVNSPPDPVSQPKPRGPSRSPQ
jgi:transcriptional regulator with PAS, ATPase and Fis domain